MCGCWCCRCRIAMRADHISLYVCESEQVSERMRLDVCVCVLVCEWFSSNVHSSNGLYTHTYIIWPYVTVCRVHVRFVCLCTRKICVHKTFLNVHIWIILTHIQTIFMCHTHTHSYLSSSFFFFFRFLTFGRFYSEYIHFFCCWVCKFMTLWNAKCVCIKTHRCSVCAHECCLRVWIHKKACRSRIFYSHCVSAADGRLYSMHQAFIKSIRHGKKLIGCALSDRDIDHNSKSIKCFLFIHQAHPFCMSQAHHFSRSWCAWFRGFAWYPRFLPPPPLPSIRTHIPTCVCVCVSDFPTWLFRSDFFFDSERIHQIWCILLIVCRCLNWSFDGRERQKEIMEKIIL